MNDGNPPREPPPAIALAGRHCSRLGQRTGCYVTMIDVPIVRQVSALMQAERPISAAQQAVVDSRVAYGWGQGPVAAA